MSIGYEIGNLINQRNIDYNTVGPFGTITNSNSVLNTIVTGMGLSLPTPRLETNYGFLGADNILISPEQIRTFRNRASQVIPLQAPMIILPPRLPTPIPIPPTRPPERHCFAAGTQILCADGKTRAIESVAPGTVVLAYDGFGALMPAKVVRLFRNITSEWLRLSTGTIVTPGHTYLNEAGRFEKIEEIVARGGAIVTAAGKIERVAAERIIHSDRTHRLYEEVEDVVYPTEGGAARAPYVRRGWRTYNFEVEGLHTYIADGVRVHNDSIETFTALMMGLNVENYSTVSYNELSDKYGPAVAQAAAWGGVEGIAALDQAADANAALAEQARLAGDYQSAYQFDQQAASLGPRWP